MGFVGRMTADGPCLNQKGRGQYDAFTKTVKTGLNALKSNHANDPSWEKRLPKLTRRLSEGEHFRTH